MTARSLVIKITAGKDDPERCNQAFNVAAAAIVGGVPVSLWLTGEASWFALPGRAADFTLPHAPPLTDLLATSCPRARCRCARSARPGATSPRRT